jgi:hypothetical protein
MSTKKGTPLSPPTVPHLATANATATHPHPTKKTVRVGAGRGCAQTADGALERSVRVMVKLYCKEEPVELRTGEQSLSCVR